MVTIILGNLKIKILLENQIYGDYEKEPETPLKWFQIKIKLHH
jgi:hypothetical protein